MTYVNDITSAGEWARLDHQARLVGRVTGLLPPLLEGEEFTSVLDVGCGPGRWALDVAIDRPEANVIGIDLSREMMEYANARARTQHLKNVSFRVQDFLENTLPFPEQSFDLIHIRFAVGWLKHAGWLLLLNRCFVLLKPGGYAVITEGEGIYTTSVALQRLHELLCAALHASGYGLSFSPRFHGSGCSVGVFAGSNRLSEYWDGCQRVGLLLRSRRGQPSLVRELPCVDQRIISLPHPIRSNDGGGACTDRYAAFN